MAAPNQGFAEAYKDVVHEDAIKIGARALPDLGCNMWSLTRNGMSRRAKGTTTSEEIAIVEETTASKK